MNTRSTQVQGPRGEELEKARALYFSNLLKDHRRLQLDHIQRRRDLKGKDKEIAKINAQIESMHEAKATIESIHEQCPSSEELKSQTHLLESQSIEISRLQKEIQDLKDRHNQEKKTLEEKLSDTQSRASRVDEILLERESTISHNIAVLERINNLFANKYPQTQDIVDAAVRASRSRREDAGSSSGAYGLDDHIAALDARLCVIPDITELLDALALVHETLWSNDRMPPPTGLTERILEGVEDRLRDWQEMATNDLANPDILCYSEAMY